MREEPAPDAGRDPWGRALAALRRRRTFRLALACLALLYASAIYAPLLANDRPLLLQGVDQGAHERARRGLAGVSASLAALARGGEQGYLAARTPGSRQGWAAALEGEARALSERARTLADALGAGAPERAELERLAEDARALARAPDAAAADALRARASALAAALRPARAGEPGGVALVARTSSPLLASLSGVEVFFMVLWVFVLGAPLWRRLVGRALVRGRPERVRRARAAALGAPLALAALVGLAWGALAGARDPGLHAAPYKEALARGELRATRVVFAPIALGFAETHLAETFRPPTWTRASEISEEGRYVRGPRAQAATGLESVPQPVQVRPGEPARNAAARHPLGTDALGRDLLVRLLYGGRISLAVGLVSSVLLVAIGTLVGALAGYLGGRTDLLLSRLIEVVLCFPVFFLILVVVAFVGPSVLHIMVVIGLLRWTGVARLVRAEFLRLQQQDFVVAARALGLSTPRVVFRHVLPNALGPVLVAAAFAVAAGILIESGLSFLGFGIQLPVPSWGSLASESRNPAHWWIHAFPGALIFLTVLCYNLVGDAIRDVVDPRTRA